MTVAVADFVVMVAAVVIIIVDDVILVVDVLSMCGGDDMICSVVPVCLGLDVGVDVAWWRLGFR